MSTADSERYERRPARHDASATSGDVIDAQTKLRLVQRLRWEAAQRHGRAFADRLVFSFRGGKTVPTVRLDSPSGVARRPDRPAWARRRTVREAQHRLNELDIKFQRRRAAARP
jgi:hypothetical protein